MADTKRGSILLVLSAAALALALAAGCSKNEKATEPVLDTIPPAIPEGIAAAVSIGDEIVLTWDANTVDSDLLGYMIYRSNLPNEGYRPLTNQVVASNSWVDAHANAGQTYYYSVAARDASNNESGRSAAIVVTIPAASGHPSPHIGGE